MSRRKVENQNQDPVEVLVRSVYRCHKAGIRQSGHLFCQSSGAGTGFFSVLGLLLSWWRNLSELSTSPFHLQTAPGKPKLHEDRPVPEHRPSIPAYSDIHVWSSLSVLSRADTTAIWNTYYHSSGPASIPGILNLKEPGHPGASKEPRGAGVFIQEKPLHDRPQVPSFMSRIASYTKLAIMSREVISHTLQSPLGDSDRYLGPRPGRTASLAAFHLPAAGTERKQETGYVGGDGAGTPISVPRPTSDDEPGDRGVHESVTPASTKEPARDPVAVRDILARSSRLFSWYDHTGAVILHSIFQGLVSRDTQIARAARDDKAYPEVDGERTDRSEKSPEVRPGGIFRFLFSQAGGSVTHLWPPVMERRTPLGDVPTRRQHALAPATSPSSTHGETRSFMHKVPSYRVGVPTFAPRKESFEGQKETPKESISGLDSAIEVLSPLLPPVPAGLSPVREPPEGRLSVQDTAHPLSLLISYHSAPGSPLATGLGVLSRYHSAFQELLERVRTIETPVRQVTASARSFRERQESVLREIVTCMTDQVQDIGGAGPGMTTRAYQGPSMVPDLRFLESGSRTAFLQAPGMSILAVPRPSLSPPPPASIVPVPPPVATPSLIMNRDSHQYTPAPAGTTNHFHNDFHITVQVRDTSDERELRDLGRKIGRVLSDELARYGGVL